MKRGFILFSIVIFNICIMSQTVQYGIFSGGSNNLVIKIQADAAQII